MTNDGEGQVLFDLTRPVEEGHGVTLVCETMGGDPLPRLSWWRGSTLVDNVMEYSDKEVSPSEKQFEFRGGSFVIRCNIFPRQRNGK